MGKKLLVAGVATATALVGLAGPMPAGAATGDPVLLNEVLASTASTDSEYVELFGTPGTSLDGLSVIDVESDEGDSNGRIDAQFDLGAGDVIGDNGFFLLANSVAESTYGVAADFALDDSLENSSSTFALVETSSVTGSTVDDTIVVRDAVGSTDGEGAEFFAFDAPVVGPDGSFLPAGVGRVEDGVDTDTTDDWSLLDFNNDPNVNTPTSSTGDGNGGGDEEVTERFIHEVQGAGDESPLVGDRVVVEGVVVGDEEGPSPALRGFFVQEEDTDVDTDPATSEGVFVFNFDNDDVELGDVVRVEGTVDERFGNTQLTDFVEVEVLDVAPRTATPATVEFPLTATSDLEAVEGMAATLSQELVITEYFNYDRFGEVVVALPFGDEDRPYTPTAVVDPYSDEAVDRAEWNRLSRITIDDGITSQNPDRVVHPINREPFTLDNRFRGGDQVTGLVGPIYFSFGQYRILPTSFGDYVRTERPTSPDDVGGNLALASMNALNYFLTLDDGTNDVCGPDQDMECRGADTAEEFERQRAKLLQTLLGLDADVVSLNEVENRPGVRPLADIVAGLNEVLGKGTYDYVEAGDNAVVGTDAIKVGLIYKRDSVAQLGNAAVLDTPAFLDPNDTGEDKNRAAVAASFVQKGTGERFSVVTNHLKSKGSPCGPGDDDFWADSCNLTRTLAAGALSNWIDSNPTNIRDHDWMILGDLNSYDHEDPIKALESEGYTDLVKQYAGELAYSYVFDGEWGYLDYAMSSPSLTEQVTGATEWHINADEPDLLDYDMTFKSPTQDALFDGSTPYRSSDHDVVRVGLDLDRHS